MKYYKIDPIPSSLPKCKVSSFVLSIHCYISMKNRTHFDLANDDAQIQIPANSSILVGAV